jgi:hypothetical protein
VATGFRPHFALIVEARSGDVVTAEPFLDLSDIASYESALVAAVRSERIPSLLKPRQKS